VNTKAILTDIGDYITAAYAQNVGVALATKKQQPIVFMIN
jgi:hypothetical protein